MGYTSWRAALRAGVCALPLILAARIALADEVEAQAQAQAQDEVVPEVTVIGERDKGKSVPDNLPAVVESLTAEEIRESINVVNTFDVIKNIPSYSINEGGYEVGAIATRTSSEWIRNVVYADDLLLSNYLHPKYRTNLRMVSPEEIRRIDVIYGPFSALYPGNSMGGVMVLETKMPDKLEAHGKIQFANESFDLYGTHDDYQTYQGNMMIGNRDGKLSYVISADHTDMETHPRWFGAMTPTAGGGGTAASGVHVDQDKTGANRYVGSGYGQFHYVEDTAKVKVAYDVAPAAQLAYTLGFWSQKSSSDAESYLTDAAGNPIYSGKVTYNGQTYNVATTSKSRGDTLQVLNGLSFKTDTGGYWDWDAVVSLYTNLENTSRTGSNWATTGAGTVQYQDGTGWVTGDLRGVWRSEGRRGSPHEISFGYHADQYNLNQTTYTVSDWLHGSGNSVSAGSEGKTRTQALYLQEAWRFFPDWTLTLGGRGERWEAFDGLSVKSAKTAHYEDVTATRFSPKAALSWQATPELEERISVGKAYRFPSVGELYQAITSGGALVINNPDLKPENVLAIDWSSEYTVGKDSIRVSLFHQTIRDALLSQTSDLNGVSTSWYQNIDEAVVNGFEVAGRTRDVFTPGLDLSASLTYSGSEITKNPAAPLTEGHHLTSIPTWRANATLTYHQNEALSYSGTVHYARDNAIVADGTDTNRQTHGALSDYFLVDGRLNYKLSDNYGLAVGVNNLFNEKYYNMSAMPQRTLFAEMRFDY